ncbi:hypothetical protein [Candidatus Nitrosoglobus terrae]|uniref:hypothetical protein n=1 Tax=Candidatus Nitrosoglobus terrae TaxID=1630141 RepID=UPI0011AB8DEF|nr:hypothetical protein [Candidatus Nitrosoglobus terrae]
MCILRLGFCQVAYYVFLASSMVAWTQAIIKWLYASTGFTSRMPSCSSNQNGGTGQVLPHLASSLQGVVSLCSTSLKLKHQQ